MKPKGITAAIVTLTVVTFPAHGSPSPTLEYANITRDGSEALTTQDPSAVGNGNLADTFDGFQDEESGNLDRVYKSEFQQGQATGEDELTYSDAYEAEFVGMEAGKDPNGVTVSHNGNNAVSCSDCYFLVKDGNHEPAQYLFNIGDWNGHDTIELSGFWANGPGAISNVVIWSESPSRVPAPAPLLMLAVGLMGLCLSASRPRSAEPI